ncbi:hypothetical protein [Sulfitobacter dubius]|uniref:Phage Tail Collar Domain n=1 Tax=Sulfitobacter dubius TaxID=218673 RepID=A0ABY3ZIP5_9RHOB|nr:hypothetical protein [Sulfitobacter dubius]UOA14537.1 hypothetical protein DSM109990_01343 [Sulfitobacter dubius]
MPTPPEITALPDNVPQNGQSKSVFNANHNEFIGALPGFQDEANALALFLEGRAGDAEAAAAAAALSEDSAAEDAGFALDAKDAAEDARDIVVPLSEQFGATYLGAFNGAPSVDANGDPLADGMLYTELGASAGLKLRLGGVWVAAAVNANGALLVANNLSEGHAPTMRANLGLTYASETEAQEGTGADKSMTPLRVAQAIAALGQIKVTETVIDASTTFEKEDWAKFIVLKGWGGGQTGAKSIGGGAALPNIKFMLASDLASSEAVTIAPATAPPAAGSGAANAGADTTLGSHFTAPGAGKFIGVIANDSTGNHVDNIIMASFGGVGSGTNRFAPAARGDGTGKGGDGPLGTSETDHATDGQRPGGGGGGSFAGNAGAGGAGRLIIWQIG